MSGPLGSAVDAFLAANPGAGTTETARAVGCSKALVSRRRTVPPKPRRPVEERCIVPVPTPPPEPRPVEPARRWLLTVLTVASARLAELRDELADAEDPRAAAGLARQASAELERVSRVLGRTGRDRERAARRLHGSALTARS